MELDLVQRLKRGLPTPLEETEEGTDSKTNSQVVELMVEKPMLEESTIIDKEDKVQIRLEVGQQ
jgi:hypothetical protein